MKTSSVVGIVNYNGKILIGKKIIDSKKFLAGEWHIPGESVEGEETYKEALIRGMKEEAGLEVRVGRYLASHITPTSKGCARWYECFSDTDNINIGSDLEDAKFVKKEDVLKICSKRAYSLWPKKIIDYFS